LFSNHSEFTDDTVMTLAVADAFLDAQPDADMEWIRNRLINSMQHFGKAFPYVGYGGMFRCWLKSRDHQPYGSYGNGIAMRVSSAAWLYHDPDTVRRMARLSAEVTHDHPEDIKGTPTPTSRGAQLIWEMICFGPFIACCIYQLYNAFTGDRRIGAQCINQFFYHLIDPGIL